MRLPGAGRGDGRKPPPGEADRAEEAAGDAQKLLAGCDEAEALRERRAQLQAELEALTAADDDAFLPYPRGNADPASCLCCCGFKRLGQSYILREHRAGAAGRASSQLVIVGPHWLGVLVTLGIVLGATGAFLDQQCRSLPWYYSILTLGFCFATVYFLFETACRDPGIVRPRRALAAGDLETGGRKLQVEQEDGDEANEADEGVCVAAASLSVRPPPPRSRYCDICGVEQAADTDHCEDCDVCVAGYDHHCPWMGKCIGRGNLRAFRLFNAAWVAYVVFVLFVAIQNVNWGAAAVHQLHRAASGTWVVGPSPNPSPSLSVAASP